MTISKTLALTAALSMCGIGLNEADRALGECAREKREAGYEQMCSKIVRDFCGGLPVRKIAKKYGISRQRIQTIIKNMKVVK